MRSWFCTLLLLTGCVDTVQSPTQGKVSTIEVALVDPAGPSAGSVAAPIPTLSTATVNIIVHDDNGNVLAGNFTMNVYISFGGIKLGAVNGCSDAPTDATPIETVMVPNGVLMNHTVTLPLAFGKTSVWVEDTATHVAGASDPIYFQNPTIPQINAPADPTAQNATFCTIFNRQYITIDHATGNGKLVVSSLFTNAFVITDTGASTYNSLYIYSFSQSPAFFAPGTVIENVSGNMSKFVGFSEFNFPTFDVEHIKDGNGNDVPCAVDTDCPTNVASVCYNAVCVDETPQPSLLPAPVPVDVTMLSQPVTLLAQDAAVVTTTGTICDPNPPNPTNDPYIQNNIDDWNNFNTFIVGGLDGSDCQSTDNFAVALPSKVYGTFDPTMLVGQSVTVVGMLKNSSGQNNEPGNLVCTVNTDCAAGTCVDGVCKKGAFNFWTITPRAESDIVVNGSSTTN